jgi:hypothetical protein
MDSTASVSNLGGPAISVALNRDRVEGSYSVKVSNTTTGPACYYRLAASNLFSVSTYSKIKVWVKPGPGAKWVKFKTNTSIITSDKNNDGLFKVGEDIKSGKWNLIILDLTKASPDITQGTQGDDLTVYTNTKSTWYYDNVSSVYAPTVPITIPNMVNNQTQMVNGNTELRFKTNSATTYDATPTILVSQTGSDIAKVDSTQADFRLGTLTNVYATSDGNLELGPSQVLFYDDFTNSIDSSKWNTPGAPHVTTDGTNAVIGDTSDDFDILSGRSGFSTPSPGDTLTFEAVGILASANASFIGFSNISFNTTGTRTNAYLNNGTYVALDANYAGSQHYWKIEITSSQARFYIDNALKLTTSYSYSPNELYFQTNSNGAISRVDWVKVSKTTNDLRYALSGNRVSPAIDISSVGSAGSSAIKWNVTTPTNTTVTVETNAYLYNGSAWQWQGWQPVTNGGNIPGISAGTNLNGAKLQYRVNLSTTDFLYTPQLNDITVNVNGSDVVNSNTLPNGKISGISINSSYANASGQAITIPAKRLYLSGVSPTKMFVSGDGKMIYYGNPADGKLYLLNLNNGSNGKLSDYVPVAIKVNEDGTKAAFKDSSNNLYLYNFISNTTTLVSSSVGDFRIQKDGTIYYYYSGTGGPAIYQYKQSSSLPYLEPYVVVVSGQTATSMDVAREDNQLYCSNTNQLSSITLTPAGWKSTLETTTTSNIDGIWANSDGTTVLLKSNGSYYSYKTSTKSLRKLDLKANCIVKVTDDNKLVIQDANYKYQIYDPDNDGLKSIRPIDAKNPASASDVLFDVDDAANKMIYVSTTGISGYYINGVQKPERYLFSFDGENSWYGYKDGAWTVARSGSNPLEDDFIKYGMTVDEVNNLKENDFSSLYEDGVDIYHFDAAVCFASTDPYTTPSLKGINAIFSAGEDDDAPIEKALYVKKQQDFSTASNWRKLKRIIATELYPKDAETFYFINVNGTIKTFKNNAWSTVSSQWLTDTSTIEANWIDITKNGMGASELRAIPETSLTALLPASSFSIVYATQVKDLSTEKYITRITCEYTDKLFTSNSLTLKVTLNSGAIKTYTGLTKDQVEDFMEWYNERQYDRGPVAYKIVTNGTPKINDFLNYYMIQSISVEEN